MVKKKFLKAGNKCYSKKSIEGEGKSQLKQGFRAIYRKVGAVGTSIMLKGKII